MTYRGYDAGNLTELYNKHSGTATGQKFTGKTTELPKAEVINLICYDRKNQHLTSARWLSVSCAVVSFVVFP